MHYHIGPLPDGFDAAREVGSDEETAAWEAAERSGDVPWNPCWGVWRVAGDFIDLIAIAYQGQLYYAAHER